MTICGNTFAISLASVLFALMRLHRYLKALSFHAGNEKITDEIFTQLNSLKENFSTSTSFEQVAFTSRYLCSVKCNILSSFQHSVLIEISLPWLNRRANGWELCEEGVSVPLLQE